MVIYKTIIGTAEERIEKFDLVEINPKTGMLRKSSHNDTKEVRE